MKAVVTGGTGNVGTAVVRALSDAPEIEEIVGLARRRPAWTPAKTRWVEANVVTSDLAPVFDGADVVIHLAWAIQPSRDPFTLERVNDAAEVARDGFEALMAGKEKVVAGSLKNKVQVAAAKVLPDSAKAAMHRRMAEPGRSGS